MLAHAMANGMLTMLTKRQRVILRCLLAVCLLKRWMAVQKPRVKQKTNQTLNNSFIMSQKRSYKQYPKEFKDEAVALVRDQGYSVPEAAKSLGIAPNMLYTWKEKIEAELDGKALAEDERTELARLR